MIISSAFGKKFCIRRCKNHFLGHWSSIPIGETFLCLSQPSSSYCQYCVTILPCLWWHPSSVLESSEASAKLILKWFTNNEIKAYPGNCHLLWSTKGGENRNIKWVNIENSQSENSDRNFKIKKGFLVYKILFFTKQIISCKYWDHNQVISSFCLRYWTWLKFIQIRHLIVLVNYTW